MHQEQSQHDRLRAQVPPHPGTAQPTAVSVGAADVIPRRRGDRTLDFDALLARQPGERQRRRRDIESRADGPAPEACRHVALRRVIGQPQRGQRRAAAAARPAGYGRGAGMKAASAGISISAAPGWLRTRTPPRRAASSKPTTPSRADPEQSSGSSRWSRKRRNSTSMRLQPVQAVCRNSAPSCTTRSSASTSAQPSSRESAACSGQCGSLAPSRQHRQHRPVGREIGPAAWTSASCHASKNGRSWPRPRCCGTVPA